MHVSRSFKAKNNRHGRTLEVIDHVGPSAGADCPAASHPRTSLYRLSRSNIPGGGDGATTAVVQRSKSHQRVRALLPLAEGIAMTRRNRPLSSDDSCKGRQS